jgi:hypothetical protein
MKRHKPIGASRGSLAVSYRGLHRARLWAAVIVCCGTLALPVIASAATLISQSFSTKTNLAPGSIVSLQKNSTDIVSASTASDANYMLGVVIDSGSSQLSISSSQINQVQVATSGVEQVLVSDINGNIAVGDPITASPISGVGMKASNSVKVIGLAQDAFPNDTGKQQTYTDRSGNKQSVLIGEVPVLINVAYFYKQPDKTLLPPAIQSLADALAGKKVNTLPILISIGIFVIMLLVVVSIIYAMIHSSIISVGRNPMAQAAVYRNVIHLSVLVLVIIMAAVGAIYMVLTRL